MSKIAQCSCGSLRAEALAEPVSVVACHCTECQRRTGAPFGVGVYFLKEHVNTEGASKTYVRDGQEGRKLYQHFCPECGTSLYWYLDLRPNVIGVALGSFADPTFAVPTRSVWERGRHAWVAFNHQIGHFSEGLPRDPQPQNSI